MQNQNPFKGSSGNKDIFNKNNNPYSDSRPQAQGAQGYNPYRSN